MAVLLPYDLDRGFHHKYGLNSSGFLDKLVSGCPFEKHHLGVDLRIGGDGDILCYSES